MISINSALKVYVYLSPVDMRKAINGLSALASSHYQATLQSGEIYLFFGKTRNKVKILYWDKNGFVLHYKRLERKCFLFPKDLSDAHIEISQEQLGWLLAGLDFHTMGNFDGLNYSAYF